MNFEYLKSISQMNNLYLACNDAERFALSEPVISLSAARRAVEYLVKLIYSSVVTPYIDDLSTYDMLTDTTFLRYINDKALIGKIHSIRKAGNQAVHEGKIGDKNAVNYLKDLHFIVGELCVLLGLIPSYNQFRDISREIADDRAPMSPVELEISQSFVAQIHKQLSNRQNRAEERPLINVHVNPRNSDIDSQIDSGANTKKAFHDAVLFLTNALPGCALIPLYQRCVVTLKDPSGKTVVIAVKSGCSQLSASVNGEVQLLPNIDLILYAPAFAVEQNVIGQLRVFTKQEFLEMWNTLGLIRKKVSSAAAKHYHEIYGPDFKTNIEQHADIISVQSFSNSGKKLKLVEEACEQKPAFLEEGIKIIKQLLPNA